MIHPSAIVDGSPEHRDHWGKPGLPPQIQESADIGALCSVDAGIRDRTYVGERTKVMKQCHIGHDAYIGDDCELAPGCRIGGHARLLDGVRLGMGVLVKPFVTVGAGARIGMGAVVIRDVPPGEVWVGNPARKIVKRTEDSQTPLEEIGWETLAAAVGKDSEVYR